MNYFKKYFLFFSTIILLNNCGGGWSDFKKTMSGEKITNTDEFLIKKKDPLVLPPEYDKLPLPKTKNKKNKSSIESILSSSKKVNSDSKNSTALENMILEELRKKN